jgi:hypothetical protein
MIGLPLKNGGLFCRILPLQRSTGTGETHGTGGTPSSFIINTLHICKNKTWNTFSSENQHFNNSIKKP